MLGSHAGYGVPKRQRLEYGAHLRDLQHIAGVQPGHADAAARLDGDQPLSLEPLERLPHRDMTDAIGPRHLVLQQAMTGLQYA